MNPKLCPKCNKYMKVLIPPSRPEKAEYCCHGCHKSIPINDADVVDYWQHHKAE